MAVRIALQCSDSDAHLILSEENTAARLLARPGEAIYNDANGLLEGNHPFQVVWLPDGERDAHLERIRQLTAGQELSTTSSPSGVTRVTRTTGPPDSFSNSTALATVMTGIPVAAASKMGRPIPSP